MTHHGMDPFRQFVKLSVIAWFGPHWMRYGSEGLSTLDVDALRHGHSTFFPHAVKYVKNASLSTLDPFAASVSTRFFCL